MISEVSVLLLLLQGDSEESDDPDKDNDEMSDEDVSDEDDEVEEVCDSEETVDNKATCTHSSGNPSQNDVESVKAKLQTADLGDRYQGRSEQKSEVSEDLQAEVSEASRLLDGDELIAFFKSLHSGSQVTAGVTTIGLVSLPFNYRN